MENKAPKILLTGLPGCGKTTAIMQIVGSLHNKKLTGFYTQEIRQNKRRTGFRWIGFDGSAGTLAHVDMKSPFKVGRYGVDIRGFDESVVPLLDVRRSNAKLFIIDEIGRIECFSRQFVRAVQTLLASEKAVLATVAQKGHGLIAQVKTYPDIKILTLNRSNYDDTVTEILRILAYLKEPSKDGRLTQ